MDKRYPGGAGAEGWPLRRRELADNIYLAEALLRKGRHDLPQFCLALCLGYGDEWFETVFPLIQPGSGAHAMDLA